MSDTAAVRMLSGLAATLTADRQREKPLGAMWSSTRAADPAWPFTIPSYMDRAGAELLLRHFGGDVLKAKEALTKMGIEDRPVASSGGVQPIERVLDTITRGDTDVSNLYDLDPHPPRLAARATKTPPQMSPEQVRDEILAELEASNNHPLKTTVTVALASASKFAPSGSPAETRDLLLAAFNAGRL